MNRVQRERRSAAWRSLCAAGVALLVIVGGESPGQAAITVTGDVLPNPFPVDGQLPAGVDLVVGNGELGELTIRDGSVVAPASTVSIGALEGSRGVVRIDGDHSTLTSGGWLTVGDLGNGELRLTGGAIASNRDGIIGAEETSAGFVVVDGAGSTWINDGRLNVGGSGIATMSIRSGGLVRVALQSNITNLLNDPAAMVTVEGAGSQWLTGDELSIGVDGPGFLTITKGGMVSNTDGYVGRGDGSNATVIVDGVGSIWANSGDLQVGSIGVGALLAQNSATVRVAHDLIVGAKGSISLSDSFLSSNRLDVTAPDSVFDFQSGRLEASTVTGDITNQAGTFAPGYAPDRQSSIDIVNFAGSYMQLADATLDMELAGDDNADVTNPQFDQLFVTGDLNLAGTLTIRATSEFVAAGQTLDLIHFDGALTGDFNRVISPTLAVSHSIESGVISVTVLGVLGDMNGSGALDAFDIDDFELALADREAYMAQTGLNPDFVGDMNRDGRFDAFDVNEFEVLLGTVGTTVPEPTSAAMIYTVFMVTAQRRRRGI